MLLGLMAPIIAYWFAIVCYLLRIQMVTQLLGCTHLVANSSGRIGAMMHVPALAISGSTPGSTCTAREFYLTPPRFYVRCMSRGDSEVGL